ncbi:BlaI/MecI/CopY family transcriptional regulator [Streptomyces sp. NPDC046985]|uniref:BlaI/MecI/CopY family transcriptional regulator n=1 Tax=Streptomyces sp. NPDC046985 TaxID=3155377 RepID=UPI003404F9D0
MPDSTTVTDLASQYVAQVAGDLDQNVKEQERIGAEISALQEQLAVLQHDHGVLVTMQQALGTKAAATSARPSAATAVPAPRKKATTGSAAAKRTRTAKHTAAPKAATAKSTAAKSGTTKSPAAKGPATAKTAAEDAKSPSRTATAKTAPVKQAPAKTVGAKTVSGKTADGKRAAESAPSGKATAAKAATAETATATAAQPTLVELVRQHLAAQQEPRSAGEVAAALGQEHPDRDVKATVVRTTLEALVAKNQAQRAKQGSSVFYTPQDAPEQPTSSGAQPHPTSTDA